MKNDTYDEKQPETSEATEARQFEMKIPKTPDKPNHSKATVSVYTEGLSVMCANEAKKTAEIAFVKEEHTGVEVRIYKDGCKFYKSFGYSNEDKILIEIKKTHTKNMGKLFKKAKKEDDDEDFEWMPDLNNSDWYPTAKITIQKGAAEHLSAKLVLQDAIFYTHQKSEFDGIQMEGTNERKNLGKVGRVLGADIFCEADDAGVSLKIWNNRVLLVDELFEKDQGRCSISVTTKPLNKKKSHLHHIYHHIIEMTPEPTLYDFHYEKEEDEWKLCEETTVRFTTYACQTFPGGDGSPPEFP